MHAGLKLLERGLSELSEVSLEAAQSDEQGYRRPGRLLFQRASNRLRCRDERIGWDGGGGQSAAGAGGLQLEAAGPAAGAGGESGEPCAVAGGLGDERLERWRGRRLFAVDGTKISVPRELLEDGCSLPSPGARCPQGLSSCPHLPDDRMPIDFELSARLCERSLAAHPPRLSAGDVAARAGCPFELLWGHVRRNVHCVFRL